jgi:hypothetical protein
LFTGFTLFPLSRTLQKSKISYSKFQQVGPFIVIARTLEAALYGQIKTEVCLVEDEEDKLAKTLEIIKGESHACVLCCNDEGSSVALEEFLKEHLARVYAIHEGIGTISAKR